ATLHACIDDVGIKIKSSAVMCSPLEIKNVIDDVRNDFAANAFHRDWSQRLCDDHVVHERVRLITDYYMSGLGNGLQARGQIGFGTDDCVIDPVGAPKTSADIAKSRIYSHADAQGMLDSNAAPLGAKARDPMLHLNRHAETSSSVFGISLGF